ncbi:MAG: ATPase [Proteobacteria bacterium]|nr:ATPase [Pseudomonadota bacterium]
MTGTTETDLRAALESFVEPLSGVSLGASGAVGAVSVAGGTLSVEVTLGFPVRGYEPEFESALREHLARHGFDGPLAVRLGARIPAFVGNRGAQPLPGISNVIAVASGKGGVGKSTVAANFALALARQGARVGVLDADIYGPSQPRMMGLSGQRPTTRDGKSFEPLSNYGVKVMSIGFLIDDEQPMVWRGPMVTQALVQLLGETRWGELDYLVVDMPPGTGDIQLTLAQRVPLSGAVVVTTPQEIALLDARKGLMMFRKVEVPVLGIVENMSVHVCPACGHASHVFGAGGGRGMAERYGVPLLGELPLDLRIREQADAGSPTVVADPGSAAAQAYMSVARRAAAQLAAAAVRGAGTFPKISIEDNE